MQNSFRSAYRKVTGRSWFSVAHAADRRQEVIDLGDSMENAYAVVLRENLDDALRQGTGGREYISAAPQTWERAQNSFILLEKEIRDKFNDFRLRWQQRVGATEMVELLERGEWLEQTARGYALNLKADKRQLGQIFLQIGLLLTNDVEKLVVLSTSRCTTIQEKLTKAWYQETLSDSSTKVLPMIEQSMRKMENEMMRNVRGAIRPWAQAFFEKGIRASLRKRFSSPRALYYYMGSSVWNTSGVHESGFAGFLEVFSTFAEGVSLELTRWYRRKWELYLRGFSTAQMDLFFSLNQNTDRSSE